MLEKNILTKQNTKEDNGRFQAMTSLLSQFIAFLYK